MRVDHLTKRDKAEAVEAVLSGAKVCVVCKRPQVSGKTVDGALFCDECDQKYHFLWPHTEIDWHA